MTSRELYARLLTYVRPYWKAFLAALACMGLTGLAEPVFPAMMKFLLDDGFSKASGEWDWMLWPLAIMALFLVRAIFGFCGDYLMSWVSNNVITEQRVQFHMRQDFAAGRIRGVSPDTFAKWETFNQDRLASLQRLRVKLLQRLNLSYRP